CLRAIGLTVGFGLLAAGGCATSQGSPQGSSQRSSQGFWPPPLPLRWIMAEAPQRPAPRGCLAQSRYTEGDLTRIYRLREQGESLKTVAQEVGGSRLDVKC